MQVNYNKVVGNGQDFDPWNNPQPLPEFEPVALDEIEAEREAERAKMRRSLKHCRLVAGLFADDSKAVEAIARKEWKRNRRSAQVKKPSLLRPVVRRVRSSASAASRHRTEDDAGGDDDSDPALFLRRVSIAVADALVHFLDGRRRAV